MKNTKQKGFSLIESLVALALVSFFLIVIAQMQSDFMSSNYQTKFRQDALLVAQNQLAEASKEFYDTDTTMSSTADDGRFNVDTAIIVESRDVNNDGVADPLFNTITVTVTWNDGFGNDETVKLESLRESSHDTYADEIYDIAT